MECNALRLVLAIEPLSTVLTPNNLPLVCLPLELPVEAVAELIDFLHELSEALERHYGPELKRHYDGIDSARRAVDTTDPPFRKIARLARRKRASLTGSSCRLRVNPRPPSK